MGILSQDTDLCAQSRTRDERLFSYLANYLSANVICHLMEVSDETERICKEVVIAFTFSKKNLR
jgi:hypothetical protein